MFIFLNKKKVFGNTISAVWKKPFSKLCTIIINFQSLIDHLQVVFASASKRVCV